MLGIKVFIFSRHAWFDIWTAQKENYGARMGYRYAMKIGKNKIIQYRIGICFVAIQILIGIEIYRQNQYYMERERNVQKLLGQHRLND